MRGRAGRTVAVQGTATGSRTLVEMFHRRVERSRGQPALRHKAGPELERPDREGRTTVPLADVLPDGSPVRDWVLSLDELRERGRVLLARAPLRLAAIADDLDPQQAATIIYTSGTTGMPKGVVLTHANLVFECGGLEDLLDLGEADEQLLFQYLVALVTLSADTARDWVAPGRLPGAADLVGDMERFSRHPEVVGAIKGCVDQLNWKLPSYETSKRFAILPTDFTEESGELTPSFEGQAQGRGGAPRRPDRAPLPRRGPVTPGPGRDDRSTGVSHRA